MSLSPYLYSDAYNHSLLLKSRPDDPRLLRGARFWMPPGNSGRSVAFRTVRRVRVRRILSRACCGTAVGFLLLNDSSELRGVPCS